MAQYLNLKNNQFQYALNSKIFIDKSLIIKETNSLMQTNDRFMCITRPHRFGKNISPIYA